MGRTFLRTLLFLTPFFLPVALVGWMFGLTGAILGIMVSIILCAFIVFNADMMMARIYRSHPVLPGELSDIKKKVWILSNRAGTAIPSIYVTELQLPSSFVMGKKPDKTILVFPARLSNLLSDDELEALMAYNIVQINSSIGSRTFAALITGIFTMAASAIRWGAVFTGFGDYNDPAPKLFSLFIMGLVAPPAATMIQTVTGQNYDLQAVLLCRKPAAFISAIEHLENNNVTAYPSLGFLCLVDPQEENFFEHLFKSHPSKETRFKNLAQRQKV